LPEGRTIYFFQVVCPDITEYYIDADQHHAHVINVLNSHEDFWDLKPPFTNC